MEVEPYQLQQQHVMLLHKEEYDDREEEEVALRDKRFQHRNHDDNNNLTADFFVSTNGNGNVDTTSSSSSTTTSNSEAIAGEGEVEAEFTNSVYFDQQNGMWKCQHCDWNYCVGNLRADPIQNLNQHHHCFLFRAKGVEYDNGSSEIKSNNVTLSALETNSKDFDVRNSDDKENLIKEMNQLLTGNLNNEGSPALDLTSLEESSEKKCANSKPFNDDTRVDDFDILEEIGQEFTEFDVERVLQKQTTHDLYCPNCNSCITRKVILRRRKLKIRNSRRKPKHDLEKNFHPELDANSSGIPNDLGQATNNTSADGSQALANDDHGREREADVFRCLSCFSLFIPTGNGLKLFRIFQDGAGKERTQNPENEHASNTNWLFSIFTTDKKSTGAEHGTVNDIGTLSQDAGYQVPNASIEEQKKSESASLGVKSPTENVKAGVDAINDDTKDNIEQKNLPCSSDDKLHQLENGDLAISMSGTVLNAALFSGDGLLMSRPQQGGGSTSVSSTFEALSPIESDNKLSESLSQVNLENNSSVTLQKKQALQNGQTSFIQGTTLDTDLQLKGESINSPFALTQESPAIEKEKISVGEEALDVVKKQSTGNDVIVVVETESVEPSSSQNAQDINVPLLADNLPLVSEERSSGVAIDILKSIVYGGLIESITSLGIVCSAAAAGTATLNILALGLANLIGGLFIIAHHLVDLKNDGSRGSSNQANVEEDRYYEVVGRRQNFSLHAVVVIISFIIFGLLPPVTYGFSFRKSDDKDMKLAVVGASSLVCIILLAAGKAHVQRQPRSYIRTILYFLSLGIAASGASYVVGDLLGKLLEKEGWFRSSSAVTMLFPEGKSSRPAWPSY